MMTSHVASAFRMAPQSSLQIAPAFMRFLNLTSHLTGVLKVYFPLAYTETDTGFVTGSAAVS
jgi:hypothetical protein